MNTDGEDNGNDNTDTKEIQKQGLQWKVNKIKWTKITMKIKRWNVIEINIIKRNIEQHDNTK